MANSAFLANRNMVINGAMQISQRGTSTAVSTTDAFVLDRMEVMTRVDSYGATWTQDTTVPTGEGFAKSLKCDVTTAVATPTGSANYGLMYTWEGQDLQLLKYGSSNAEDMMVSFWVRSSTTGTYCLQFANTDASKSQLKEYSISSANTWEKKTILIEGDTANSITSDNTQSLRVSWWLSVGPDDDNESATTSWSINTENFRATANQINLFSSTSNDFYITGIQVELGSVATPFEHETFGETLQKCQRYYEKSYNQGTNPATTTAVGAWMWRHTDAGAGINTVTFQTPKRTTPTMVSYGRASGTSGKVTNMSGGASDINTNAMNTGENSVCWNWTSTGSETYVEGHWTADAEL